MKCCTSNLRKPQQLGPCGLFLRSSISFFVFCWMGVRLVFFILFLFPAFVKIGWWYMFSQNIHKSISYGPKIRQSLDIYVPNSVLKKNKDKSSDSKISGKKPVLIFTGGGAWIVGHKCFCALIGKIFMNQDIIVVAPDYRQFPQVRADDMLHDVDTAIQWTFDNIHVYGGDVDLIFLCGQSAGAHLTSTLVLEHAREQFKAKRANDSTMPVVAKSNSSLESIIEGPGKTCEGGDMDDEMLVEESSLDRVDDELKKILKRRRRKSHSGSPEQLDKIIEANKQKAKQNAEQSTRGTRKDSELNQVLRVRRRKSETGASVHVKEGAKSVADAVHPSVILTDDDKSTSDSTHKMCRSKSVEKLHAKELVCQKWKLSRIKGYIGISGPYHLPKLREHLFDRGIEQLSFLTKIVGGESSSMLTDAEHEEALHGMSPALRLRRGTFEEMRMKTTFVTNVFPRMLLIHGDSDNVVPKESTKEFAKSLRRMGATVTVKYLAGASHTDPIIEDLLYDESNGKEAGAINELIDMINLQRTLHYAAAAASEQRSMLNNPVKQERRRSPSMLADGFGFVTEERGTTSQNCLPRLLIRAARLANPF